MYEKEEMAGLAAAMSTFASDIDGRLVPRIAMNQMLAVARQFGDVSCEFALEVHLNGGTRNVDLVVRIHPGDRDRLCFKSSGVSSAALDFLGNWAAPSGGLTNVPYVELEYDLNRGATEPWIGPAVEPLVKKGPLGIFRAKQAREGGGIVGFDLAARVLDCLPISRPSNGVMSRLRMCYDALPETGSINHFTAVSARPSASDEERFRLIVSLPRYRFHEYLDAIGWRGDRQRVEKVLRWFKPYTDRVDFDLDICADHAGQGTAFYSQFRCPRLKDAHLMSVLESLVEREALTKQRAVAIRNWIQRVDGRLDCGLTFKLSLKASGPPILKLYFSKYRAWGDGRGAELDMKQQR